MDRALHRAVDPLRVVMLGPFGLHPKGTMRARALPAARALAARGHQVHVLMPPWHSPEEVGRRWREGGVALDYISLAGLDLPGAGHGLVAARLARRALALAPDVIHAFKPKAYSGLAAGLLWARRRVPGRAVGWALVMDTDDWEGPGGWNDLESYSRAQRAVFARQERWGLGHAHHVTVASRALETLAWSLGLAPDRVSYVPNAIEQAPAGPVPDRPASGSARVLLYTRFHEFELDRPLRVLQVLRQAVPAASLVVAGHGLHGEEKDFLARAADLGLAGAVDCVGWLADGAAAELFAGVDAALVLSDDTLVNRSRSSMKLLDLMAAGVPVVAEAVGQNEEVIEEGRSGRLVAPGDVAGLAAALAELLGDSAGRQALGQGARDRVARDFCWSVRVADLEAVYVQALGLARPA